MSNEIDIDIEIGKIPDVPVKFDGSGSQDIEAELDNGTNKSVEVSVESGTKSDIPVSFEPKSVDIGVELEKATNYEHLSNKPRINGVELVGNKTTEELGIEMPDVSDLATKDELDQKQPIGDYALKSELPVIPTKVSAFENDKGYLTEHQDISGLATEQELEDKQDVIPDLSAIRTGSSLGATAVQPSALNDYATKQSLTDGLATKQPIGDYALKSEIPDISGKQDTITDLSTIRSGAEKGETAVQPSQLSAVATSGDYNDLTNKPTIPTKTSELQNDSEFITIASLSGYATQDWVQSLGYITGITSSDVTIALGYTPLKQSDLSPYAKTETVQGWLRSKQNKLEAGEGITIEDDVISATGGGGGGDVVEAIAGQSIYPYEIVMTREWENPYRMQNVYLGGDIGLSVDDVVELPEGSFAKSFNITNGERETEFSITSMNDKYVSYFRFNSNQIYIDYTGSNGVYRNLTISLRYGTVYYADSERGDFEFDLYDVMNALNNLING